MTENSRPGLFARLRQGLARSRERLGGGIADLLLGRRAIDALTVDGTNWPTAPPCSRRSRNAW